jgi:RND family efflux transporter MFP subunit
MKPGRVTKTRLKMKKLKLAGIAILFTGAIIFVLFNNRAKIQAKTNDDKIDSYPVITSLVEKSSVERNLNLVGTITANNDVAVVAEAAGKVTAVYAKTGDYKSAGSVLFQLDDELKEAAYKTAEVNYEKTKKDYERYNALHADKSVTDAQLESARLAFMSAEAQYITARREYNDTKIKAPISGVITSRLVDVGNYVGDKAVVANIVDISKLKVKLNVAEKDAFKLKKGDEVEVTTDVYPDAVFRGRIESISDKGDDSHTYPVEITLPNSSANPLKAGMFGRVSFSSIKKSESLIIPRESLIGSVKDAKVFVVENGAAKLKKVTIGNAYDKNLEVLSGLNGGERIVVNGQNNLKDNDKVFVKE